jgi:LysM repeat protein
MSGSPRMLQSMLVLVALIILGLINGCNQGRDVQQQPVARPLRIASYMVVEGDTISSIAARFSVDAAAIIDANLITDHSVHPGQLLSIPGGQLKEGPVLVAPKPVIPASVPVASWYIPRSSWAVEPIILRRTKPMGGTPTRITVHHSGDVRDGFMDPIQWLRAVDHQHMLGLGKAEPWACIGYHFIISADGRVFEGRPLAYQGAHAGWDEVNRLNIGVCLIGDFDKEGVPPAQHRSLLRVLDRLCEQYGISHAHVYGHSHFKVTDCPGRNVRAIIEVYRHHQAGAEDAQPTPVLDLGAGQ